MHRWGEASIFHFCRFHGSVLSPFEGTEVCSGPWKSSTTCRDGFTKHFDSLRKQHGRRNNLVGFCSRSSVVPSLLYFSPKTPTCRRLAIKSFSIATDLWYFSVRSSISSPLPRAKGLTQKRALWGCGVLLIWALGSQLVCRKNEEDVALCSHGALCVPLVSYDISW